MSAKRPPAKPRARRAKALDPESEVAIKEVVERFYRDPGTGAWVSAGSRVEFLWSDSFRAVGDDFLADPAKAWRNRVEAAGRASHARTERSASVAERDENVRALAARYPDLTCQQLRFKIEHNEAIRAAALGAADARVPSLRQIQSILKGRRPRR